MDFVVFFVLLLYNVGAPKLDHILVFASVV